MRVFKVFHDSNRYAYFLPKLQKEAHRFSQLNGTLIGNEWVPPKVELYKKNRHKVGNFFQFASGCLLFDRSALDTIGESHFRPVGEVLPFTYKKQEFYLLNITHIVDCLDYAATVYERGTLSDAVKSGESRDSLFSQSMLLGRIVQFAFHSELLPKTGFFKLPQVTWTNVFYSDSKSSGPCSLLDDLEQQHLVGLVCEQQWHG